MKNVLLATDADEVFDEVDAAVGDEGTRVHRVHAGKDVRQAALDLEPDLVMLDLQIGNMGGAATCMDLRLEEGVGRMPPQRILLLLDRTDDEFLAKTSGADGWVTKPLNALKLRRAAQRVLARSTEAALP